MVSCYRVVSAPYRGRSAKREAKHLSKITAAQTCAPKQRRHSDFHENDLSRLTATLIRIGSLGRDIKYVHACRMVSDGREGCL
jgi:hypothetical protein